MRPSKKPRISKRDWLLAALEAIETSGIDAVKVEQLAVKLHVSKSGFYWHFKDKYQLNREILTYWTEEYTKIVINELNKQSLKPLNRLEQILEMVWKDNLARYDLAIRTWANHDPIAKKAVTKVTKLRMDYLRNCFYELGFRGDDLEVRIMLCLSYMTLEKSMFGKMSHKRWESLKKRRLKILLKK